MINHTFIKIILEKLLAVIYFTSLGFSIYLLYLAPKKGLAEKQCLFRKKYFGIEHIKKPLEVDDFINLFKPKEGFRPFIEQIKQKLNALGFLVFFIALIYHAQANAELMRFITDSFPTKAVWNTTISLGLFLTLCTLLLNDPSLIHLKVNLFFELTRYISQSLLSATYELSTTCIPFALAGTFGTLPFIRTFKDALLIPNCMHALLALFSLSFISWWLSTSVLSQKNQPLVVKIFYRMPTKGRFLIYGLVSLPITIGALLLFL